MRVIRLTAIITSIFVAHVALVSKLSIFGVHPDLLLIVALCVAVSGGRNRGAIAGFIAGTIADTFMTSPLGLSALAYTVACYGAGAFAEDASTTPLVASAIGAAGALAGFALFVIVGAMTGQVDAAAGHAVGVWIVEAMCAALVVPVGSRLMRNAWTPKDSGSWAPRTNPW